MAKHSVVECECGVKNLRTALAQIDLEGKRVVSVVPNTGGTLSSMFLSGSSIGYLIVVVSE